MRRTLPILAKYRQLSGFELSVFRKTLDIIIISKIKPIICKPQ